MRITVALSCAVLMAALATGTARAQFGPPPSPGPPQPAQKAAPLDLSGYWVSIVTEDWRWRMLTPPHGDYASVPLNPTGKKLADMWTTAEDGSCKAYYAAGLMRMPTRVHISWANENTLKIQSDWGEQTRMIYFRRTDIPEQGPTPQGSSLGAWEFPVPVGGVFFGRGPKLPGGDLKVVTDRLAAGWLRRNGVPYGTHTQLLEHYQTFSDPTGKSWFDVTTEVTDPEYLSAPFLTSSDFRHEADGSNWAPHPCKRID